MPHDDDDGESSWVLLSSWANLTWLRGWRVNYAFIWWHTNTEKERGRGRERQGGREGQREADSACKQLGPAQGCVPAASAAPAPAKDFSYAIITIIIILLWKETEEGKQQQQQWEKINFMTTTRRIDDGVPCPKVVAGKNQLGNTRQKGTHTHTDKAHMHTQSQGTHIHRDTHTTKTHTKEL